MQGAGAGASALQLLGLRARGLPAACAAPLALTTALFAGPLLLLAWPARPGAPRPTLLRLPRLQARPGAPRPTLLRLPRLQARPGAPRPTLLRLPRLQARPAGASLPSAGS